MTATAVDMTQSTDGAISSPMVAALEDAWSEIRARHPELPHVVIVLGAGSGNGPGLTLGHFAAMRWRAPRPAVGTEQADPDGVEQGETREDVTAVRQWAEVFVGGEALARGPADVITELGTVLRLHRAVEITSGGTSKPSTPPCVCGCGRKIRVSNAVLSVGPIHCGICDTEFRPDQQDEQPS